MTRSLAWMDAGTREQIVDLLRSGKPNIVVARQLDVDVRAVAQIRKDASLPPAPRSAWTRRPHPQARRIRVLLDEGHTDVEVGRQTGADVSTVARIRKEGGFGPATITRRGTRPHPKEAQIRDLITKGWTNNAIARELGVDRAAVRRIRKQAGMPNVPQQPLTLEEKWASHTRPVEGGHLEWTGERAKPSSTPVLRYWPNSYSPAAVAFRIKHGRDAVGYAIADCGLKHCVAPDHVDDEPGRQRTREQLRYVMGGRERKPFCRHGHDQAEHGRYEQDGRAYCEACKAEQKRAERQVEAS